MKYSLQILYMMNVQKTKQNVHVLKTTMLFSRWAKNHWMPDNKLHQLHFHRCPFSIIENIIRLGEINYCDFKEACDHLNKK